MSVSRSSHAEIKGEYAKSKQRGITCLKEEMNLSSPAEKLLLTAYVINQISPTEAEHCITSLSKITADIYQDVLPKITLPGEEVDRLIEFLLKKKLLQLSPLYKAELYLTLAAAHREKGNDEKNYFLEKLLLQPNLLPTQKHWVYFENGIVHLQNAKAKAKALEFFRLSYQIEGKLKAIPKFRVLDQLLLLAEHFNGSLHNLLPTEYLIIAQKLATQNPEIDKATLELIDKVITHADSPECLILLADTLDLAKLCKKAMAKIPILTELIQKNSSNVGSKAYFKLKEKKYDQAVELARAALLQNPEDEASLYNLAVSLLEQTQLDEAKKPLLKLLEISNDNSRKSRALVILTSIAAASGRTQESQAYLTRALLLDGHNIEALAMQISTLANKGDLDTAKNLFSDANAQFPNHEILKTVREQLYPPKDEAENGLLACTLKVLSEVTKHMENKQFSVAETHALNYLELKNPPYIKSLIYPYMAEIYWSMKRYEEAMKYFRLIELAEHKLMTRFILADVYQYLGEPLLALETADDFLQNMHTIEKVNLHAKRQVYETLHNVYHRTEADDKGITAFREQLKKASDPREQKIIKYYLACFYHAKKDYILAENTANEALSATLENDVIDSKIYSLLTEIHLAAGKANAAIDILRKTLKKKFNIDTFVLLGKTVYEAGNETEALKIYTNVIKYDPSRLMEVPAVLLEKILAEAEKISADNTLQIVAEADASSATYRESSSSATSTEKISSSLKSAAPPALTKEQLRHIQFQSAKNQDQEDLHIIEDTDTHPGWEVPGIGLIKPSDMRVEKLYFSHHDRASSHLYCFIDQEKLSAKVNNPDLMDRWRALISVGKIVGKKKQQGIRLLTETESKKVATEIGEGYIAKLKLLGGSGNPRAYARMIKSVEDRLLVVDAVKMRH